MPCACPPAAALALLVGSVAGFPSGALGADALAALAASDDACCGDEDLSLLQLRAQQSKGRAQPLRAHLSDQVDIPAFGKLAERLRAAASKLLPGGSTALPTTCFGTPVARSKLPTSGEAVHTYLGAKKAEQCLLRCLEKDDCLSVVFEPANARCHSLPEVYEGSNLQMLVADDGALIAEKDCSEQCGFADSSDGSSAIAGTMLMSLSTTTLAQCQEHCLSQRDCHFVVFRQEQGSCSLKAKTSTSSAASDNRTADELVSNKVCQDECSFKDPSMLSDYERGDHVPHISNVATLEDCQHACEQSVSATCFAVIFSNATSECHLLAAAGTTGNHYFGASDSVYVEVEACKETVESNKKVDGEDATKPTVQNRSSADGSKNGFKEASLGKGDNVAPTKNISRDNVGNVASEEQQSNASDAIADVDIDSDIKLASAGEREHGGGDIFDDLLAPHTTKSRSATADAAIIGDADAISGTSVSSVSSPDHRESIAKRGQIKEAAEDIGEEGVESHPASKAMKGIHENQQVNSATGSILSDADSASSNAFEVGNTVRDTQGAKFQSTDIANILSDADAAVVDVESIASATSYGSLPSEADNGEHKKMEDKGTDDTQDVGRTKLAVGEEATASDQSEVASIMADVEGSQSTSSAADVKMPARREEDLTRKKAGDAGALPEQPNEVSEGLDDHNVPDAARRDITKPVGHAVDLEDNSDLAGVLDDISDDENLMEPTSTVEDLPSAISASAGVRVGGKVFVDGHWQFEKSADKVQETLASEKAQSNTTSTRDSRSEDSHSRDKQEPVDKGSMKADSTSVHVKSNPALEMANIDDAASFVSAQKYSGLTEADIESAAAATVEDATALEDEGILDAAKAVLAAGIDATKASEILKTSGLSEDDVEAIVELVRNSELAKKSDGNGKEEDTGKNKKNIHDTDNDDGEGKDTVKGKQKEGKEGDDVGDEHGTGYTYNGSGKDSLKQREDKSADKQSDSEDSKSVSRSSERQHVESDERVSHSDVTSDSDSGTSSGTNSNFVSSEESEGTSGVAPTLEVPAQVSEPLVGQLATEGPEGAPEASGAALATSQTPAPQTVPQVVPQTSASEPRPQTAQSTVDQPMAGTIFQATPAPSQPTSAEMVTQIAVPEGPAPTQATQQALQGDVGQSPHQEAEEAALRALLSGGTPAATLGVPQQSPAAAASPVASPAGSVEAPSAGAPSPQQAAPQAPPPAGPQAPPRALPQVQPPLPQQAAPQAVPQALPQALPQAAPRAVPQAEPQAAPAAPQAGPPNTPQASSSALAALAAEAQPSSGKYDLSWLADAGVPMKPSEADGASPLEKGAKVEAEVGFKPKMPNVAPSSPATLAVPAAPALQAAPAVQATFTTSAVQVPGGPKVLVGGFDFSGATPAAVSEETAMTISIDSGSAFSVAFSVTWKELTPGTRILDLSDGDTKAQVVRVSSGATPDTLEFAVTRDGSEVKLDAVKAFVAGTTQRFLCTVSSDGKMEVLRDGMIIARLKRIGSYADGSQGGKPLPGIPMGQFHLARPTQANRFTGWIGDVCAFKRAALWNDAANCVPAASKLAPGTGGSVKPTPAQTTATVTALPYVEVIAR